MGMHVESQVIDLVEGFVANGALVLLLSAVGQLVVLVVACDRGKRWKKGLPEGAGAHGTQVRWGRTGEGFRKCLPPCAPVPLVKLGPCHRGAARNWHGTNERQGQPGDPRQMEGSGLGPRPGTSHLKSI